MHLVCHIHLKLHAACQQCTYCYYYTHTLVTSTASDDRSSIDRRVKFKPILSLGKKSKSIHGVTLHPLLDTVACMQHMHARPCHQAFKRMLQSPRR
jgi:hypothetical protein